MATRLNPCLRPDHCVALMLGEAISEDCEAYEVTRHTAVGQCVVELPSDITLLDVDFEGRTFQAIVYELPKKEGA